MKNKYRGVGWLGYSPGFVFVVVHKATAFEEQRSKKSI